MKQKKLAGFTLFELLVVISIIGLLVSLVAISYSNAQTKARDAKAKAEIKAISSAFEQYYASNDTYDTCDTMGTSGVWAGEWPPRDSRNKAYDDGTANPPYAYYGVVDSVNGSTASCTVTGYLICADLEQDKGGNSSDDNATWASDGGFFCLVNQQ